MKVCAECNRLFGEDGGFCPLDGTPLKAVAEATPPSDPEDKRVGSKVCAGRYEIWRKVADGGMGRVYQALDTKEGRGVALKILHPEVAVDPVSVERFKREFELSASLPHEHIVEVLDFERTEDSSYALVMEYLEGEELRMLLKRQKTLPPERVIRMLSHAAQGLGVAHERKFVHRDLKPDNIFLCGSRDGDVVKLLDFGSVRDNSIGAKKLTVMGTTIGSPYYMAPEQAQGLPSLDHRADVWSLAAIAYECLTGKVPFEGSTGPAILLAILTQDPKPPSEVGKALGVPVTLDEVIEEALAKEPSIRIPTVAALADRVGAAYGLSGTHADWGSIPEGELGEQIKASVGAAVEKHKARRVVDTSALDAAFKPPGLGAPAAPARAAASSARTSANDDPFRAGSAGGPAAFDEDLVMGVPTGPPKWLVPSIVGAVVVLGTLIAIFVLR